MPIQPGPLRQLTVTPDAAEIPRSCAVLGSPIDHSLSPALHRAAYEHLGLNWSYQRVELTADQLRGFVDSLDHTWRGLSLTMPLKEAALTLGEADDVARLAGAGNTVVIEGTHRRVYNTDVGGLRWAIQRRVTAPIRTATILGAGATARSALLAAVELGARQLTAVARTASNAERLVELAEQRGVGLEIRRWADTIAAASVPPSDVLLSAMPAGAADPLAVPAAMSAPVVFDASYAPWPTKLAEAAELADAVVVSGRELLVGQALLQIELMTERSVPSEVLFDALPG